MVSGRGALSFPYSSSAAISILFSTWRPFLPPPGPPSGLWGGVRGEGALPWPGFFVYLPSWPQFNVPLSFLPLLPRFTTRIALEEARDTCYLSPTSASHQVREARPFCFPLRFPQKNREQSPASFAPVSALLSQKQQLSEPEGTTQIRLNLHASDQDQAQKMEMTYQRAHVR